MNERKDKIDVAINYCEINNVENVIVNLNIRELKYIERLMLADDYTSDLILENVKYESDRRFNGRGV